MPRKRYLRPVFTLVVTGLIMLALVYAFRPRPVLVDLATAQRGQFLLTIDEEARTRVHDAYIVSAPITGRLMRVALEPGDAVVQGQTLVARMLPSRPPALDIRQREQAEAAVKVAEAALGMARANHRRAEADHKLAVTSLERARKQIRAAAISQAYFDEAEREAQAAAAELENTGAQISLRQAELSNARAAFTGLGDDASRPIDGIAIHAPVSGSILQVFQKSETIIAAGTPILEIGDIQDDLEIVVELLSGDAVKVKPGDPVIIDNWGGDTPLSAVVDRVDPLGFTKVSTLGVEEQRVNTRIRFTEPDQSRNRGLGHGFRVEARIVLAREDNALMIPTGALFRQDGDWAAFTAVDGLASLRVLDISKQNGREAVIAGGLSEGETVILYPPADLEDGTKIEAR